MGWLRKKDLRLTPIEEYSWKAPEPMHITVHRVNHTAYDYEHLRVDLMYRRVDTDYGRGGYEIGTWLVRGFNEGSVIQAGDEVIFDNMNDGSHFNKMWSVRIHGLSFPEVPKGTKSPEPPLAT